MLVWTEYKNFIITLMVSYTMNWKSHKSICIRASLVHDQNNYIMLSSFILRHLTLFSACDRLF